MLSDAILQLWGAAHRSGAVHSVQRRLTAAHAAQFCAYVRQVRGQYSLHKILGGEQSWPDKPEERDILYFLAQSLRAQLLKELPRNRGQLSGEARQLAARAKELLLELSNISLEIAQMAVTPEGEDTLPAWVPGGDSAGAARSS